MMDIQEELSRTGYESVLRNRDELYIECTVHNVKKMAERLWRGYKLRFIAQLCRETEVVNVFKISLVFINNSAGQLVILSYDTEEWIVSFQDMFKQSHLFEREIMDLFGLEIRGGVEKRHFVKHEVWEKNVFPMRKSYPYGKKIEEKFEISPYRFKKVTGDEGYQIPVGPVHAGIIEPGHFRFSVIGEDIENLEIRLNYKHRGIEKIAENLNAMKLTLLFERVACESTAAYAESYALLVEKLLKRDVPKDIQCLRVVLLEMERLYNFLDDLGGVCVDVGYSYPAKKLSYMSEIVKQLAERITGSRYMRNAIVPMGINIYFDKAKADDIRKTLEKIYSRVFYILNLTTESFSFLDRVEHTGIVNRTVAEELLLTGVTGRAAGINYDIRKSFPYEIYSKIKKNNNMGDIGGVFERYKLKISELRDSFKFINLALDDIGSTITPRREEFFLEEGDEAFSLVETVKGELMLYGKVGKSNVFDRIYLKTPSFTNWQAITVAVVGEIVPDFPLCNKSLNLSYAESDK